MFEERIPNDGENTYEESSYELAHGWKASASKERVMNPLIVIIDDSICTRKILEVTLRRAGYEARSFPDGFAAIQWLNSPEGHIPALIFVDLVLPKMDGHTLLRRLKARPELSHTVLVMLSGRTGVVDRLKGRLAGASEYLTKPFTTQQILGVVNAYLGVPPDKKTPVASSPRRSLSPLHPIRLDRLEGSHP